jgi:hypothetical protein
MNGPANLAQILQGLRPPVSLDSIGTTKELGE